MTDTVATTSQSDGLARIARYAWNIVVLAVGLWAAVWWIHRFWRYQDVRYIEGISFFGPGTWLFFGSGAMVVIYAFVAAKLCDDIDYRQLEAVGKTVKRWTGLELFMAWLVPIALIGVGVPMVVERIPHVLETPANKLRLLEDGSIVGAGEMVQATSPFTATGTLVPRGQRYTSTVPVSTSEGTIHVRVSGTIGMADGKPLRDLISANADQVRTDQEAFFAEEASRYFTTVSARLVSKLQAGEPVSDSIVWMTQATASGRPGWMTVLRIEDVSIVRGEHLS